MRRVLRVLPVLALAAILTAPTAAPAEPLLANPFGSLSMKVMQEADPVASKLGKATLTIHTDDSGSLTKAGKTVYFGLRIMGSEELELTGFRLTKPAGGCVVSDFAGTNAGGDSAYQGAPLFGADAGPLGDANSRMRMIGGYLKGTTCGNLQIDVQWRRAQPVVAYYAAFFGLTPAPWNNRYDTPPWNVVPTGGNDSYRNWWNLWGSFDTLGYSNFCTKVSGAGDAAC